MIVNHKNFVTQLSGQKKMGNNGKRGLKSGQNQYQECKRKAQREVESKGWHSEMESSTSPILGS